MWQRPFVRSKTAAVREVRFFMALSFATRLTGCSKNDHNGSLEGPFDGLIAV
jgi:hypothetical protein